MLQNVDYTGIADVVMLHLGHGCTPAWADGVPMSSQSSRPSSADERMMTPLIRMQQQKLIVVTVAEQQVKQQVHLNRSLLPTTVRSGLPNGRSRPNDRSGPTT